MKVGAIAVFLVAAALPAGSENLLLNPGFEHGPAHGAWPDSWGCYGWCGQEFWASRQGSNGVAFWTWNDGAWGGCWQDVSLSPDPGDRLLFSIWGLAESNFISSKEEAWIQIEMYTADSDTAVETVRAEVYNRLVSHSEQWVPLAVEAIVPTISLSRITVKFGGGGFINGGHHQAVMWDDACLSVLPGRRLSSVIDGTGTIRLCWPADTQRYFQIWAATDIRGPWTWLRDVILGNGLSNVWADPGIVAQFDQLFYRVVAVPTNAPQDADHDGLDDMAELTREGLDPADPDSDDDTIPDGSDPRPTIPNEAPQFCGVQTSSPQNFHTGGSVIFVSSVLDPDGDEVYFRWAVDSTPTGSWQQLSAFAWTPMPWQSGLHRIFLEFDDGWGARSEGEADFVIFYSPPRPWD